MANVIGHVRRKEDPRFLRGEGRYVDDLPHDDGLYLTFVRSPLAHARITAIDASEARARPGVQVFLAEDLGLGVNPVLPQLEVDTGFGRPFLAAEKVRFAGDIVAAVLTETGARGEDAAELVFVDYDPLPAVVDPREAVRDETLLFEGVGTNVALRRRPAMPDEELFAGCEVVTAGTLVSQRLAVAPLEPRATTAAWDGGRLTMWLSSQTPHTDRQGLARAFGLDAEQVRVVAPDVGGGFGGKGLAVEDVIVAAVARRAGRPVRWVETRSENLVAMHQGRAQRLSFRIGGGRDGRVHALRVSTLVDCGAYPFIGVALASFTRLMASGVYKIPRIDVDITVVVTNTPHTGPLRGAGRPEATQVVERAIDAFAADLGLDPAEVRRINFIAPGDFPFTTAVGATYDVGDYERALDLALERAGYEELRAEQRRRREAGDPRALGIGLSTYVEITNGLGEAEYGAVEITADGGAVVRTGSFSHGQGHETTFAMIAAERLGLPVDRISVLKGDTDEVPRGTGTYGSKSTQIGGAATDQASAEVVEKAREIVADLLEAAPADVVLDPEAGRFGVAGSPDVGLTWAQLAGRLDRDGRLGDLKVETEFRSAAPTFPFGAHVAVVEVDTETGGVDVRRMIAVDDAGTIINPVIADGQVHGGLFTGIAQALYEEAAFDADGNPVTGTFVSYSFPSAAEMPSFERVEMVTPTPVNPLGVKGIGESGTIGATPAVHNAVLDALAPFGVRSIDMPANGERVWRAIREVGAASG